MLSLLLLILILLLLLWRRSVVTARSSRRRAQRLKNAVNDGDVGYGVRPLMAAALTQAVSAGGISRKQAVAAEVTHSQVDCVASMFKAFIRELSPSVFPRESYAAAIGAFTDGGVCPHVARAGGGVLCRPCNALPCVG